MGNDDIPGAFSLSCEEAIYSSSSLSSVDLAVSHLLCDHSTLRILKLNHKSSAFFIRVHEVIVFVSLL